MVLATQCGISKLENANFYTKNALTVARTPTHDPSVDRVHESIFVPHQPLKTRQQKHEVQVIDHQISPRSPIPFLRLCTLLWINHAILDNSYLDNQLEYSLVLSKRKKNQNTKCARY